MTEEQKDWLRRGPTEPKPYIYGTTPHKDVKLILPCWIYKDLAMGGGFWAYYA